MRTVRRTIIAQSPDSLDEAPMFRECPLCSERMRLVSRETVTRVPGTSQEIRNVTREWVCGECDYFEENEDPGAELEPGPRA